MAPKLSDFTLPQLEIELMNTGKKLLHLPPSTAELLNILTEMHQILLWMKGPPYGMLISNLQKITKTLHTKQLLTHPDMNVNIAVAYCILDILRVNAPPHVRYDDKQLKEFFELVMVTFEKLSSTPDGCYRHMIRFLIIFCDIKSPVLMLNLGLDRLVVRLFKQFLTIADISSCAIVFGMEKFMTMIILGNEGLTRELVDLIITSVRKENQIGLPVCWQLGRQVIKNCDALLKKRLPDKVELIHEMASELSGFPINQLEIELINAAKKLIHGQSSTSELLNVLTQIKLDLSRMNQPASGSTIKALHPIIDALSVERWVTHHDMDVILSAACCIIEILIVMAPNAPYNDYNDKNLQDLFDRLVIVFEKLSSAFGGCDAKMTLLLKVFNRARLPAAVSGLQVDRLVVRLFKQLLSVAERLGLNSAAIFVEMEKSMTMIIEENEELTQELVYLIVTSVRMEEIQNGLCCCRQLGKQVIKNGYALLKERLPDKVVKQVYDSLGETIPSTTDANKLKKDAAHKRKLECLEGSKYRVLPAKRSQYATRNDIPSKKQSVPTPPTNVSSPQCDVVCVYGYKVKQSNAPILESIFKKHGDITSNCVLKTLSSKTYFLEVICEVVRRIQTNDVTTIISDMKEIECQVSDVEAVNINVSWLRAHLEAIYKNKDAKEKCSLLMEMKTKTVLVKRAANLDLVEARKQFEMAERCVKVLDLVEKKLNDNILESKSEIDLCLKEPIL